ncbi:phosphatase PAP2 family protein [Acidisphaera sp. L21]|uniref:phosphatase PAP2 family protein n=1 Tax=Acidisphaera sp. L21 TaxID=1641851 RepID=UPI00131B27B6|nr:phosphatase PAP2 family protein [Acidisphaera sp. L21]
MIFLSDFADQAVVLPLATVVALVLGVLGWWRGVLAWVGAICGTLAVMLVLKLCCLAIAEDFEFASAASPSGHVASACIVYGGLAVLLLRDVVPRIALGAIAVAIIVAMGYSRIELHAHDLAEVIVGGFVGAAGLCVLGVLAGPRPRIVGWPVLGAAVCTMLAFHGMHLPAEAAIRSAFTPK